MTLWFGVGLIIYIHLLFFLVAYFSQVAFQRLESRLNLLSPGREHEPEDDSKARANRESAEAFDSEHAGPVIDAPVLRQRVLELALEGAQPAEIAAETEMPRAEVDFLIKLSRRKKPKAHAAASS